MSALLFGAPPVSAATSVSDCGQFRDYTPPDPAGPTDGTITLGQLSPWTIAADASLSSAITTNLPTLIDSQPTCLALDLDDSDRITAMDFAASGAISGPVVYDSGFDGYVFADRLLLPASVATSEPGLEVLFVTSADAGSTLRVAFDIDPATGAILGFHGRTRICGTAELLPGGKASVGGATLPAAALDPADTDAIDEAGTDPVCASIRSVGTIDPSSGLALTITVVISAATAPTITPPPTSTTPTASRSTRSDVSQPLLLLATFAVGLLTMRKRRHRRLG